MECSRGGGAAQWDEGHPGAASSPAREAIAARPGSTPADPDLSYLIEWWTEEEGSSEPVGRWTEEADPNAARLAALAVVGLAVSGRVRLSLSSHDETIATVATGRQGLEDWDASATLPAPAPGRPLPPRSDDDIRSEVLRGCRDAMALAVRARMLRRERVVELLHGIAVSFDPGIRQQAEAE